MQHPDRAAIAATLLARQLEAQQGTHSIQPLTALLQQPSPLSSQAQNEAKSRSDSLPEADADSTAEQDNKSAVAVQLSPKQSAEVMWQPDDALQDQSQPHANPDTAHPPGDAEQSQPEVPELESGGYAAPSQQHATQRADTQPTNAEVDSWHSMPSQATALTAIHEAAINCTAAQSERQAPISRLSVHNSPTSSAQNRFAMALAAANPARSSQQQAATSPPHPVPPHIGRSTLLQQPLGSTSALQADTAPALLPDRQPSSQPKQGRRKPPLSLSEPEVFTVQAGPPQEQPVRPQSSSVNSDTVKAQQSNSVELVSRGMKLDTQLAVPKDQSRYLQQQLEQQQRVKAKSSLLNKSAGQAKLVKRGEKHASTRSNKVVSSGQNGNASPFIPNMCSADYAFMTRAMCDKIVCHACTTSNAHEQE